MTLNFEMAKVLLNNNGLYHGDPQVGAIYVYNNQFNGGEAFLVATKADDLSYMLNSPAVLNPRCLWTYMYGLTPLGKQYAERSDV